MKAAIFLLTAAGAALAQDLSGQPECATACVSSAISAAGCEGNDMACQCGPTMAAIVEAAAPCLLESCDTAEVMEAQQAGEDACSSFQETASNTDGPTATTTEENPEETTGNGDGDDNTTATEDQEPTTTEMVSTTTTDDEGNTVTTEVPEETDTSTAAAAMATPAILGAGAVMGVLGVVAAL